MAKWGWVESGSSMHGAKNFSLIVASIRMEWKAQESVENVVDGVPRHVFRYAPVGNHVDDDNNIFFFFL